MLIFYLRTCHIDTDTSLACSGKVFFQHFSSFFRKIFNDNKVVSIVQLNIGLKKQDIGNTHVGT